MGRGSPAFVRRLSGTTALVALMTLLPFVAAAQTALPTASIDGVFTDLDVAGSPSRGPSPASSWTSGG